MAATILHAQGRSLRGQGRSLHDHGRSLHDQGRSLMDGSVCQTIKVSEGLLKVVVKLRLLTVWSNGGYRSKFGFQWKIRENEISQKYVEVKFSLSGK